MILGRAGRTLPNENRSTRTSLWAVHALRRDFFLRMIAFSALAIVNTKMSLAQDLTSESELVVQTIADNLRHPTGIAIHPQTGIIFVAEQGAQQIVRVVDGNADTAVFGFRKEVAAEEPREEQILHLAFIDQSTLAVIVKSLPKNEYDILVLKNVSTEAGKKLSAAISSRYRIGRTVSKDLLSDLTNFAQGGFSIFLTGKSAENAHWLAKGSIAETGISKPVPVAPISEANSIRTPTAIACSPMGFLTVGFVGADAIHSESSLAFFDDDGGKLGEARLDLADVWGLAYHPTNGRLFALGRQKGGDNNPGLFQIVTASDGLSGISHRVLALPRPTAFVFDAKGELFVSLHGEDTSVNEAPMSGFVIKISGLDASHPTWLAR
jgi:hypothetical protein